MGYTFDKTLEETTFGDAIIKVTDALQKRGFGILTTIDVQKALKEKIDKEMHPYTILGACSPQHAYQALLRENKIGSMLPCNVVVQEKKRGQVEVSAVDPVASMTAIQNMQLRDIAFEVQKLLREVINGL